MSEVSGGTRGTRGPALASVATRRFGSSRVELGIESIRFGGRASRGNRVRALRLLCYAVRDELTGGRVSARGTWRAVRARVVVVVQGFGRAGRLAAGLVRLRERVLRRVCALVMLRRRLVLRVLLVMLVDDAGRARVLELLRRRVTLLLVVGLMLHMEKWHQ